MKILAMPFIMLYKLVIHILLFHAGLSFRRFFVVSLFFLFLWSVHVSWFFFSDAELQGTAQVLSIIGLFIPFLGAFNGIYQGVVSPVLFLYAIPISIVLTLLYSLFLMINGTINNLIESYTKGASAKELKDILLWRQE